MRSFIRGLIAVMIVAALAVGVFPARAVTFSDDFLGWQALSTHTGTENLDLESFNEARITPDAVGANAGVAFSGLSLPSIGGVDVFRNDFNGTAVFPSATSNPVFFAPDIPAGLLEITQSPTQPGVGFVGGPLLAVDQSLAPGGGNPLGNVSFPSVLAAADGNPGAWDFLVSLLAPNTRSAHLDLRTTGAAGSTGNVYFVTDPSLPAGTGAGQLLGPGNILDTVAYTMGTNQTKQIGSVQSSGGPIIGGIVVDPQSVGVPVLDNIRWGDSTLSTAAPELTTTQIPSTIFARSGVTTPCCSTGNEDAVVQLENTGTANLNIQSITFSTTPLTNAFAYSGMTPVALSPTETRDIRVYVDASTTARGTTASVGTIHIQSDDPADALNQGIRDVDVDVTVVGPRFELLSAQGQGNGVVMPTIDGRTPEVLDIGSFAVDSFFDVFVDVSNTTPDVVPMVDIQLVELNLGAAEPLELFFDRIGGGSALLDPADLFQVHYGLDTTGLALGFHTVDIEFLTDEFAPFGETETGENFTFTLRFEVVEGQTQGPTIPEPVSVSMLLMGGVALLRRSRRSRVA